MGIDEPSEFDLLLGALERAVDEIGGPDEPTDKHRRPPRPEDENTDLLSWLPKGERLIEAPPSLVDLRALKFDDPLSHQMTQPVDLHVAIDVGTVVENKYEILGPAPRTTGGWEARHVVLRQKFILQFLARSIVDDPLMWPKFQHDIKAAGLLGHENIEFVTDLGRDARHGAYLVKQWIDGPTLHEWLSERDRVSPQDAVGFAHAVGGALAALHEIGIIHGRLSPSSICRIDSGDGPVWKVLDVCIPGGDEVLIAPEQRRGEATGPEADQYAVAYLTWMLLGGVQGSLNEEPEGAPPELLAVLRTALDDMPLMRWPDIETFVSEISQAVPVTPTPTIHPFDRREASRLVNQELEARESAPPEAAPLSAGVVRRKNRVVAVEPAEPEAPAGTPPADAPPAEPKPTPAAPGGGFGRQRSMVIRVLPEASMPAVEVQFNTGARLRREYRRNMLVGGLFAPTAGDLTVGGKVTVKLGYGPKSENVTIEGTVVSHDPGGESRPRGYGVVFDPRARQSIESFVKGLGLGLGISPEDSLKVLRPLDSTAKIDAGAAFLLSRLSSNVKVGAARAMFSGLPYDFDECVSSLVEEQYVSVEAAESKPRGSAKRPAASRATPRTPQAAKQRSASEPAPPRPAATPKPKPEPKPAAKKKRERPPSLGSHEWSDVARVLDTVAYFEEQGNFMAAGRVLESATANAPKIAAYHHRLALQRARFDMDLAAARASIRIARNLDPKDEEFSGTERYIATLIEIAAVRVAWERSLNGKVSWVRTEPALGLLWFEELGAQVGLHKVDYLAGSSERKGRGAGWRVVAENDPEFDSLERRRPVPIRSGRERHTRQIELARRFGGFGPHFEREPLATIRTLNSTLDAIATDGLKIRRNGSQLGQLSSGKVCDPVFSPNEQYLAWTERVSGSAKWGLHVGQITGPGTRRAVLDGRPEFFWSDDSSMIFVLDTKTNTLSALDRRKGDGKVLLDVKGSMDVGLVRSIDDDSAVVFGRRVVGKGRWFATWLDLKTGELRGEYALPSGASCGVVRSDGKLALVLRDGRLLVADLERKIMKPVSTCSPDVRSVLGAQWKIGSPLVVAEINGSDARVLSLDVDLLVG